MSQWDTETAEWYAEKYGNYDTNELGLEALTLFENATVVDIGCGTGCALRYASDQVTSGTLIGIDPVPRMVEIAIEQTADHPSTGRIEFHEGSAEEIPIENDTADFVFAFDSFDHWHNQALGLKEIHRILKSSGQLIVVKDGGLPNGSEAKDAFKQSLDKAGFKIKEEKDFVKGSVKCTRWIYSLDKQASRLMS